jgi:hypothetical protein
MKSLQYFCPVCGYDALEEAPAEYSICPCCGTEFGYHDLTLSWEELRNRWVAAGAHWFSKHTVPPLRWAASAQLARLAVQNVNAGLTVQIPDTPPVSGEAAVFAPEPPLRTSGSTEEKRDIRFLTA